MKKYLVGGAIRDKLLGLTPKEKDWVVVGSTPKEMKKNGFKQVGKDFPVFIHPETGEEYALARTERKSGHGYGGFKFDTDSNVTLEEDLKRRDLTINAIAEDESGNLIDPFKGQEDIKNKKLRHVSDAFSEDPLRVLRLARFKAKFREFDIVPETVSKVKEIVDSGELGHLTGERVWLEMYKAENIAYFHEELVKLGASDKILGLNMISLSPLYNSDKRWEELVSSDKKLYSISGFIWAKVDDIFMFCDQLKIPNEYKDLAMMLRRSKLECEFYQPQEDEYKKLIKLIDNLDIRKTERLNHFLKCLSLKEGMMEFFTSLIEEIKNFRLSEEDQKKSKDEIIMIIKNTNIIIAKKHISQYLNS